MAFRRSYARQDVVEPADPAVRDVEYDEIDERPGVGAAPTPWSPAQLVGLVIGIGFTVLGIAAVARTGFDVDHIYRPHYIVWHLPHSPLLAVSEIGFGVLMVLASVVPGGVRSLMALLGAISLAFGIVILVDAAPDNLTKWFAVTDRSGWLFAIVGAVTLLVALVSPVFFTGTRRTRVHSRTMRTTA
jgi:hypothetical protein